LTKKLSRRHSKKPKTWRQTAVSVAGKETSNHFQFTGIQNRNLKEKLLDFSMYRLKNGIAETPVTSDTKD